MTTRFPALALNEWRETRDALHAYARVIGWIRRELTPRQKHWWHSTLLVSSRGLTTTPVRVNDRTFEVVLNPVQGRVEISTSTGGYSTIALLGQSQRAFHDAVVESLGELDVLSPKLSVSKDAEYDYHSDAAMAYWHALSQIESIYKEFKGTLREETGPVQVFPHHFDLSLNWFSGRRVPGADPTDEESADEQMNFGFVTGDESFAEAYFYATAYPTPDQLTQAPLPDGAYWHTEGFTGAVLPYDKLSASGDPRSGLLEFLRTAHTAGAALMK